MSFQYIGQFIETLNAALVTEIPTLAYRTVICDENMHILGNV